MKKLINAWKMGWKYVLNEDPMPYYRFFTIIFIECACLWAHYPKVIAFPFTLIFFGYILNVIVSAWFADKYYDTKLYNIINDIYVITFIVLCIIGCFINVLLSILLIIIPILVTRLWFMIEKITFIIITAIIDKINKSHKSDYEKLCKIHMFLSVLISAIVLAICLAKIDTLPALLSIIISIFYMIIIAPLSTYYENEIAPCLMDWLI